MAVEIEVRFLVFQVPSFEGFAAEEIEQGYLCTDPACTVRVRRKGGHGFLTIKGEKTGASAPEFEYAIPPQDLPELMKLCGDKIVTKNRYKVPGPDRQIWELDIFSGRHESLIIAELELPAEGASYIKPDWVGPEITIDRRFSNANLALTDIAEIQGWVKEYGGP